MNKIVLAKLKLNNVNIRWKMPNISYNSTTPTHYVISWTKNQLLSLRSTRQRSNVQWNCTWLLVLSMISTRVSVRVMWRKFAARSRINFSVQLHSYSLCLCWPKKTLAICAYWELIVPGFAKSCWEGFLPKSALPGISLNEPIIGKVGEKISFFLVQRCWRCLRVISLQPVVLVLVSTRGLWTGPNAIIFGVTITDDPRGSYGQGWNQDMRAVLPFPKRAKNHRKWVYFGWFHRFFATPLEWARGNAACVRSRSLL